MSNIETFVNSHLFIVALGCRRRGRLVYSLEEGLPPLSADAYWGPMETSRVHPATSPEAPGCASTQAKDERERGQAVRIPSPNYYPLALTSSSVGKVSFGCLP